MFSFIYYIEIVNIIISCVKSSQIGGQIQRVKGLRLVGSNMCELFSPIYFYW